MTFYLMLHCIYIIQGADVNSRDYQNTPILNVAIRRGFNEAAMELIDRGADVNAVARLCVLPISPLNSF